MKILFFLICLFTINCIFAKPRSSPESIPGGIQYEIMQNKIFVKIKTKQHPANYHVHRIMFVDEMGKVVWTLYADAVIFKTENQVFIVEIAENLIGAKFAKIAMMLYNDYAGRIELYN